MFLQSSKSIKSKILTAALEVDQDYRRHRQSKVELEVLCKDIFKWYKNNKNKVKTYGAATADTAEQDIIITMWLLTKMDPSGSRFSDSLLKDLR